ncbi:MAG TPA: DcrB-related protein [Myxococcota bacterium]|jgi:hypothetical protein
MPAPLNGLPLAVPKQWALSQLMLHFEGEDFTDDDRPFAATALVQTRLDVPAGTAPSDVVIADLATVKKELAGFDLVEHGTTKLGAAEVCFLEFSYAESQGRRLRQLTFYMASGKQFLTVTGTHVEGERFDAIRPQVVALAQSVLSGLAS